jgi:hypothetical protein
VHQEKYDTRENSDKCGGKRERERERARNEKGPNFILVLVTK